MKNEMELGKNNIEIIANDDYRNKLKEEVDFYNKHPFLVPFVGSNYGKNCPKLLVVLESHYLPVKSKFYEKISDKKQLLADWYNNWNLEDVEGMLDEDDIGYIDTKSVVEWNMRYNGKFQKLFLKFLKPIYDIAVKDNKEKDREHYLETMNDIAFMNYFLRPSESNGKSIKDRKIDRKWSFYVLNEVWMILNKPIIIFCSSKAKNAFIGSVKKQCEDTVKFEGAKCILLNHPGARSWKRGINSEEDLIKGLKGEKIFTIKNGELYEILGENL